MARKNFLTKEDRDFLPTRLAKKEFYFIDTDTGEKVSVTEDVYNLTSEVKRDIYEAPASLFVAPKRTHKLPIGLFDNPAIVGDYVGGGYLLMAHKNLVPDSVLEKS